MKTARCWCLAAGGLAVVLGAASAAALGQATNLPSSTFGTGTSNFGSAFGSSAFGTSAFGNSTTGTSGLGTSSVFPTFSQTQNAQRSATTAARPRTSSASTFGAAPTLFVCNPKDIAAIVAAACRKPCTSSADAAVVKDLVDAMAGSDASRRESAERRLADLGESAAKPLADVLRAKDVTADHRAAAARLMVLIGPPAVPSLTGLMKNPAADVRLAAARALGAIGDRTALGPLLDTAADRDEAVRLAVIEGLGNLHQAPAVVVLAKTLQRDSSVAVREAAAASLGRLGCRAVVEPLVEALSDPQVRVRQASAKALAATSELLVAGLRGELGRSKTRDALAAALADKDPAVRAAAVEGLGALRDQRAVGKLTPLLSDPDLRLAAIRALGRIGGDEALEPLQQLAGQTQDDGVRRAATEAIGSMQKP
jgi:HEAT repeat protein